MTYKYNSNQKMPLELVRNIVIFTEFSIENSCMEVDTDNNKEIELNIRIKYNDNKSNISLSTTSVDEDVNKLFNEVSTIVEKG
jgi:hypothetical protein